MEKIHANSENYIYNILVEVPYSEDIIENVVEKLEKGTNIRSIFPEGAIIPEERKQVFEQKNFQKYVKDGILERKMTKTISIVTVLNDKEAGVLFPLKNGDPDLSEMFYSNDPKFHEWCLDYFNEFWNSSGSFIESKLSE